MLGVQGGEDPTLSIDMTKAATLGAQGGWDPTLSFGEAGVTTSRVQEFWNPTLRFGETIIVESDRNPEMDLGSTHFVLTVIFHRFLQAQLSVGMHSLPWLRRFFHEHMLREEYLGKLKSLQIAEVFRSGNPLQQEGLEVTTVFQIRLVQLKAPKDSWKTIHSCLLPLLEGKQFEKEGFVTSHLSQ